jgi:hypothetical protein
MPTAVVVYSHDPKTDLAVVVTLFFGEKFLILLVEPEPSRGGRLDVKFEDVRL